MSAESESVDYSPTEGTALEASASDVEMVVASDSSGAQNTKNTRNVQTQHGDYRSVDAENIFLIPRCLWPESVVINQSLLQLLNAEPTTSNDVGSKTSEEEADIKIEEEKNDSKAMEEEGDVKTKEEKDDSKAMEEDADSEIKEKKNDSEAMEKEAAHKDIEEEAEQVVWIEPFANEVSEFDLFNEIYFGFRAERFEIRFQFKSD